MPCASTCTLRSLEISIFFFSDTIKSSSSSFFSQMRSNLPVLSFPSTFFMMLAIQKKKLTIIPQPYSIHVDLLSSERAHFLLSISVVNVVYCVNICLNVSPMDSYVNKACLVC